MDISGHVVTKMLIKKADLGKIQSVALHFLPSKACDWMIPDSALKMQVTSASDVYRQVIAKMWQHKLHNHFHVTSVMPCELNVLQPPKYTGNIASEHFLSVQRVVDAAVNISQTVHPVLNSRLTVRIAALGLFCGRYALGTFPRSLCAG